MQVEDWIWWLAWVLQTGCMALASTLGQGWVCCSGKAVVPLSCMVAANDGVGSPWQRYVHADRAMWLIWIHERKPPGEMLCVAEHKQLDKLRRGDRTGEALYLLMGGESLNEDCDCEDGMCKVYWAGGASTAGHVRIRAHSPCFTQNRLGA